MWFVIIVAALVVVVAGLVLRRHRRVGRTGPSFDELSRDEQVQVMRHAEGRAVRRGDREGAKHRGDGRFGETAGPGS
ncbi:MULTISPECIES: hypothetical protein [Aeromicrobium]|uniref:hypothetical protein n=1 Tax=Aeromicrobium TaxID=2040 RepID=UPI0006F7FBFF|nr:MULTISPECIES: hypothetical protein [Aeromicrobium]KQX75806.1 hypothetical protein ASD10_11850 [Aeromicrobium sp. Root472D3]MCL8250656.1 hypothetical protein [Aeromicrobium fastidiosum]